MKMYEYNLIVAVRSATTIKEARLLVEPLCIDIFNSRQNPCSFDGVMSGDRKIEVRKNGSWFTLWQSK